MKKTNKCQICNKRYKLPQYPEDIRTKICFTCEAHMGAFGSMTKATIDFYKGHNKKIPQTLFELLDYYMKYLIIVND